MITCDSAKYPVKFEFPMFMTCNIIFVTLVISDRCTYVQIYLQTTQSYNNQNNNINLCMYVCMCIKQNKKQIQSVKLLETRSQKIQFGHFSTTLFPKNLLKDLLANIPNTNYRYYYNENKSSGTLVCVFYFYQIGTYSSNFSRAA